MSYTRFVIISHLRSGTHLLRTLLESHPAIVCQTEVFNSDNPNLPYSLTTPTQAVLDKWVFKDFHDGIQCVGFVLQAYHPHGLKAFPGIRANPLWSDVWPRLQNMPGLRVIHLQRDNSLRRHLSHVIARRTGGWHHWNEERALKVSHIEQVNVQAADLSERPVVELDAERLRIDFEDVERLHQRVKDLFSSGKYLSLSYEKLCSCPDPLCKELLRFLGVSPAPLEAAVAKIENRPLHVSIANFQPLREAFANTPWHHFFDEPGLQ